MFMRRVGASDPYDEQVTTILENDPQFWTHTLALGLNSVRVNALWVSSFVDRVGRDGFAQNTAVMHNQTPLVALLNAVLYFQVDPGAN
jgi:hypothetical protein